MIGSMDPATRRVPASARSDSIGVRVVGTVPINSATLAWDVDAPPKNWKALVDHAERFHIFGAWAAVMSFTCFLVAFALFVTSALTR
jgi:hypothetical protein